MSGGLWHPFTPDPAPGPKALLTRAQGAYVYDDAGKRWYDGTSSWWCNLHGHCHPRLVAALSAQAARLDHVMMAPHAHPAVVELSERLLAKLGEPYEKVFYSDDGSTAVEAALKMAVQYQQAVGRPRKRLFAAMERAYHGDTLGAVSVSHVAEFHRYFEGVTMPVIRTDAPTCYRCPLGETYPSCRTRCLDEGLARIERSHEEIAAVIVEPLILGAGGMLVYPREYLERLTAFCRERGILVIFDEVFTGFGRTGTMFALEQLTSPSLRPDIVCLSKGLTAGMLPMGATVTTGRVYSAFTGGAERAFYHGHTFTGNALGCAVGIESLKIFDDERVLEKNLALQRLMAGESDRFRALPHVGDVRQLGMVWAVELVADKASKGVFSPANGPGWRVAEALWERGYWLRPLQNLLYVIPPYCSSESDLQGLFGMLYSLLQSHEPYER